MAVEPELVQVATFDPDAPVDPDAVIDLPGIAELLDVAPTTPQQWRQREQLPDPDVPTFPDTFPDKPLWYLKTIIEWAKETNRWPPGRVARPRGR